MNRPVCVSCGCYYRCWKNDVVVETGELKVSERFSEPSTWVSHEIRSADLWRCPECEGEIVIGFAQDPLSHSLKAGYAERLAEIERGESSVIRARWV